MTPTDTRALRALQEAMERKKPYYPEWINARYVLSAALLYAADDLLDELDQLREQVARVEAWYGWRRGTDVPDEALAAPADTEGVSRESIEQVRWAEANPNAVALDEVEANRRDTAEGGE